MRSVFVRVYDTEGAFLQACKAGDIEYSKEVEKKVCFFLSHLFEKLWKKFQIEDIDIQFLLAKKVDFDITLSDSHLEEYHKKDKEVLQQFSGFRLKVNDIRSYISLEQNSAVKWNMINYLEIDDGDEEKKKFHSPFFIPKRSDYMDSYFLDLDIMGLLSSTVSDHGVNSLKINRLIS